MKYTLNQNYTLKIKDKHMLLKKISKIFRMRYICAIFNKSKYGRNAYFRKNQQNLKIYKHN